MKAGFLPTIYATSAQITAGDADNKPGITIIEIDSNGTPTGTQYTGTTTAPDAISTASTSESQFQGSITTSTFPNTGSNPDNTIKAGDNWHINANITFTATASNTINGAASGTFPSITGDELKAISNSGGVVNWSILFKELGYTPENSTNKGAASGYAPLDGSSQVPSANLPQATDVIVGAAAFEGTVLPIMDGVAAVGVAVTSSHSDHVHPTDTSLAPIASPTFTGTPAVPTAAIDTNTTQIASTEFVLAQASASLPLIDGTATTGVSTRYSRDDHIHPTDTSRAASGANLDITSLGGLTTPLSIAQGGTGQDTAAEAITALTGVQTSGYYLRSDGTNAVLAPISAGDVPTLNQNTTGTASNVTGTVAVANGGTGATTASAARTALDVYSTSETDARFAANDAMVFKGVIDCSANPNYPAADRGDTYRISVAGKIGGASGVNVEVGDIVICITDGTSSGDQAAVGSAWDIIQTNIDGAVTGPTSSTSANIATFNGTSGKVIQDSGKVLPSGDIVGTTDIATLTNKTISGASNTITNVSLTTGVTGTLPVANGGTGVATLASNGVMLGNGTDPVQVTTAGSADQVLRVPGAGGAPAFGAVDLSKAAAVSGLLPIANQWTPTSTLTTSTVLTAYQHVVLADSTSGTLTLTLPAAATTMHLVVKKVSATATADVVITPPSGTIDGAASKTIDTQYESTTITSDGTNYFII